jgi:two-component system, chemotaxis family, chemotaxis protein CheY
MQNATDPAIFKLPPVLDLAAAEGFLDAIRRHLQPQAVVRIDAGGVDTLTLPCIQVILAAQRAHDQLFIENPSAAFAGAFSDLGFDLAELCRAPAVETPDQAAATALDDASVSGAQDHASGTQPSDASAGEADDQAGGPRSTGEADHPPVQAQEQTMAKRILTIDDSKTIRDMLMLTLADAGFDVVQAVDGQDGLDVLEREQFDVVITDINMPRMDGYEVIRRLRSDDAHKTTPILVLTTESEADKKNLARVAGATGWMVKPFDPDRLIATINKVAP